MHPLIFVAEDSVFYGGMGDHVQLPDFLELCTQYGIHYTYKPLSFLEKDEHGIVLVPQQDLGNVADYLPILEQLSTPMLKAVLEKRVIPCSDISDSPIPISPAGVHANFKQFSMPTNAIMLTSSIEDGQYPNVEGIHWFTYSVSVDAIRYLALRLVQTSSKTFNLLPHLSMRPKKFLCMMNYPRSHRVLTLMSLLEMGVIDQGLVSWCNGFEVTPPSEEKLVEIVDDCEWWMDKSISRHAKYIVGHTFQVDDIDNFDGFTGGGITTQTFHDTYFSIVTETHFDKWYELTEKAVVPIVQRHPFVLLAGPGCLAALRERGLATFHPYIDESYDREEDPAKRFAMAFQEISKLCRMTLPELHKWYHGPIFPILERNITAYLDRKSSNLWSITDQMRALL